MPKQVAIPRDLTTRREAVEEIELHAFEDVSKEDVCASAHVGLVASRGRLAKQPRLAVVCTHGSSSVCRYPTSARWNACCSIVCVYV